MDGGGMLNSGMYVDILGHFTHGKAHVSIEFVPYLYRKAMMFSTDIWSVHFFYASNWEMRIIYAFESAGSCSTPGTSQVRRSTTSNALAAPLTARAVETPMNE